MAGPALPPADPPHAWVVEYRPLDRCSPPECKIRTRDVHGYAKDTMEDGEPGAYVGQGAGLEHELFYERGLLLRPGESLVFDLPAVSHVSELDVMLAAAESKGDYDAAVTVGPVPAIGAGPVVPEETRVRGTSAAFLAPKPADAAKFERYGRHLRLPLPSRKERSIRVSIVNRGSRKLSVGSPFVMKRVEGRGPRQALVIVHDAVLFHEAIAFLKGGTRDAKADWVKDLVADRGVYFPGGQSPGQGTQFFSVRFFTGAYFQNAWGWPGMYGKGFDETLPAVLPTPVARFADQGFVTALYGSNFLIMPNFGNVGFDVGYNSERNDHPARMAFLLERWAVERPHDDAFIVWWNSATHAPYPPGRKGSAPPPTPASAGPDPSPRSLDGTWRNLLEGADQLKRAYDALAKAAPHATRVMWVGSDHSSAVSSKMGRRTYRGGSVIRTSLLHACGGTSEEANTPFAVVIDEPGKKRHVPRIVEERTSSLVAWRAFETYLSVDLGLPRSSSFETSVFADPRPPPVWDDRLLVSVGCTATLRATRGDMAYALFEPKLTAAPAWTLTAAEQLLLVGGPSRSNGVLREELFDDRADPYELENLAGNALDDTLRMRRELTDWVAAHYEDHSHPRHRSRLVFAEPVDVELFAPRNFTALAGETSITSTDRRLAHLQGKEITIVEGAEPVGIVEVHGAKGPLVLKCSANGLPLDALTPDHPRFNLDLARVNCPLPEGPHDVAGPGEVLFSFEPAAARPVSVTPGIPAVGNAGGGGESDELLQGMKRWGYVRDIDEKKKR